MPDHSSEDLANIEQDILAGGLLRLLARREFWFGSDAFTNATGVAARLHNAGSRDVLAEFAGVRTTGVNDFTLGRAFWQLISQLDISAAEFIAATKAAVEQGGLNPDDFFLPEPELEAWFDRDPLRAAEMIETARQSAEQDIYVLNIGLRRGAKRDAERYLAAAIDLSDSSNARSRFLATHALAEMDLPPGDGAERAISHLESRLDAGTPKDRSAVLNVLAQLLARDLQKYEGRLVGDLEHVRVSVDPDEWRDLVIDMLWRHHKLLNASLLTHLLLALDAVELKAGAGLGHLENTLYFLVTGEHWPIATDFLARLLTRQSEIDLRSFNNLKYGLHASPGFSTTCCRWLITGNHSLCMAVRYLLNDRQNAEETVVLADEETRNLIDLDRLRLARRAIGYLFATPLAATSFVVAALRGASDQAALRISSDLLNPLLYCFSKKVRPYLETVVEADPAIASWVSKAMTEQKAFHQALGGFEPLPELEPSGIQRIIAADVRHDEQVQMMEGIRAEMPLMSIIPTVKILFGDATVSYFPKAPGSDEMARSVMPMHTIGYEGEAARLAVWDQVGLNLELHLQRTQPPAP